MRGQDAYLCLVHLLSLRHQLALFYFPFLVLALPLFLDLACTGSMGWLVIHKKVSVSKCGTRSGALDHSPLHHRPR